MDHKTKEYYRNSIKEIARKTNMSEIYIAKKTIELCNQAEIGTKQSHIGLHTFFIDDKAIDVNSFKKKNNIDSDLNSWFENNTEYLQKHSVVYKCLVFTFDDGIVNNIKYSEKNFNE